MKSDQQPKTSDSWFYGLAGKLAYSRLGGILLKIPPFPSLMQNMGYRLGKDLTEEKPTATLSSNTQAFLHETKPELLSSFQEIVYDIVKVFGFAGAMVAPYEQGDVLPVRALYIDPQIVSMEKVREWETQISQFAPDGRPVSISNPDIARVFVHKEKYRDNLSVKAAIAEDAVISNNLFDLFTPIAPDSARDIVKGIQKALEIDQVIAVPFFIDTIANNKADREYVGNLFVGKRGKYSEKDRKVLTTLARLIASSIRSERRRLQSAVIQDLILDMQRDIANEEAILSRIAQGMVNDLGYVAAMVAICEQGILPMRAICIDPIIADENRLANWDDELIPFCDKEQPISLSQPNIMKVLLHDERFENNIGVRAAVARSPILSNDLFDLFMPALREEARPVLEKIQHALGIKQILAVPFFLDQEYVGNLFAATRSEKFSNWEIELLQAFGRQAAVGVHNAKLYKQSENRREASYILGRIAFSASALVHTFRNHLGVIRGNVQLLDRLEQLAKDDAYRRVLLDQIVPPTINHLNKMTDILDGLRNPWHMRSNVPVDVNVCIHRAIIKIEPALEDWATFALDPNIPSIKASPEILTEIFANVIKNAVEALAEKGGEKLIRIESRLSEDKFIEVVVIDEGIGIRPEHIGKVSELRWTTKVANLGFGLFWAKDYIEGVGGKLLVESTWKKGTTIRMHLPINPHPLVNIPISKVRSL